MACTSTFSEYYDEVQEGLKSMAGMDQLLPGNMQLYVHRMFIKSAIRNVYKPLYNIPHAMFQFMYFLVGMLSKSRGQVLRIATILHMLFSINSEPESLSTEISDIAVKAAVNFVKTACQQTAYIAGKGLISEEVQGYKTGMYILVSGVCTYIYLSHACVRCICT